MSSTEAGSSRGCGTDAKMSRISNARLRECADVGNELLAVTGAVVAEMAKELLLYRELDATVQPQLGGFTDPEHVDRVRKAVDDLGPIDEEVMTITENQAKALHAVGQEIGMFWAEECAPVEADPDYDFVSDWQRVREVAIGVGIDWSEHDTQPENEYVQRELWTIVEEGYHIALCEMRSRSHSQPTYPFSEDHMSKSHAGVRTASRKTPTVKAEKWALFEQEHSEYWPYTSPSAIKRLPTLAVGTVVKAIRRFDRGGANARKNQLGVVFGETNCYGDHCGPIVKWLSKSDVAGTSNIYPGDVVIIFVPEL